MTQIVASRSRAVKWRSVTNHCEREPGTALRTQFSPIAAGVSLLSEHGVVAGGAHEDDAQLFPQTRTLRIRHVNRLDFSNARSTSPLQAFAFRSTLRDFHRVGFAGR